MTEAGRGIAAMTAACTVWGLSPLYYKALASVPAAEVLAHRTIWSCVFFALLLGLQGRLAALWALMRGPMLPRVLAGSAMISCNWGVYIWSVQVGRTLEASMGYFVFPLAAVLMGMVVFGERLSRGQAVAVGFAIAAVAVLTLGLGVAPWVALFLAVTFAFYGVLKKRTTAGPVLSVGAEVLALAPVAAIWLWALHGGMADPGPGGAAFGGDPAISALLIFSGVLTGGPLVLMSYASRRVSMASLGLVQYINPTLMFLCAVIAFGEPFTRWHGAAFALILVALVIYTVESLRQDRAARRRVPSVSTSGTTDA